MNALEIAAAAQPPELYEDESDPTVTTSWEITTTTSADWALQRKAECDAEAEDIDRQAEAAIQRIRERATALKTKAWRGSRYFEFKLEQWAERNRDAIVKGKAKSRAFVHGLIGWRKVGGKLAVKDAAALAAWLATQPAESGLYRVKLEPEMRALQARFKETGEVFPGCEYEPEDDRFYVKAEAPETALAKE
jgi:phage host-nuclease inhibitor protein Gam